MEKTSSGEPKSVRDFSEGEEPRRRRSKTGAESPKRVKLKVGITNSEQEQACMGTKGSKCVRSEADVGRSSWAGALTEVVKPGEV